MTNKKSRLARRVEDPRYRRAISGRGTGKILVIARGPIKLKPTQAHKNKKVYNRKKEKVELKSLV